MEGPRDFLVPARVLQVLLKVTTFSTRRILLPSALFYREE